MTSNSAMNSEESSIIPDNLQLQPTEEEQQMKIVTDGLAWRQDDIRTGIGDIFNKESIKQVPTLPAAENLIKKLEELSEEDRNALIEKFGGTRVHRFTKDGQREYITLQIGRGTEDGRWEIAKQAYDKDGKPKGRPRLFDHPDKIKYREWKLPTADKLPNISELMTYRRPDGKLLRGTYDGMDESGIITLKVGNDKIYLNNDNLLAYEHDGKRAFPLRVPAQPKPPAAPAAGAPKNQPPAAVAESENLAATLNTLESGEAAGEDAAEEPPTTENRTTATPEQSESDTKLIKKVANETGESFEIVKKILNAAKKFYPTATAVATPAASGESPTGETPKKPGRLSKIWTRVQGWFGKLKKIWPFGGGNNGQSPEKPEEEPEYAHLDLNTKGQLTLKSLKELRVQKVAYKSNDGHDYFGLLENKNGQLLVSKLQGKEGEWVRVVDRKMETPNGLQQVKDVWIRLTATDTAEKKVGSDESPEP